MVPIYCAGGPLSSPHLLLNSAQTGLDAISCDFLLSKPRPYGENRTGGVWTASDQACGVARRVIEGCCLTLGSLRLAVQDVALSRRKQGFDSPRERQ